MLKLKPLASWSLGADAPADGFVPIPTIPPLVMALVIAPPDAAALVALGGLWLEMKLLAIAGIIKVNLVEYLRIASKALFCLATLRTRYKI